MSRTAPAFLPLLGAAEYQSKNYKEAGEYLARAAETAAGARRGFLAARAGDAFERAGLKPAAAMQYRAAATWLPDIAGWLAVREARVSSDTAMAFVLLGRAPPEAVRLALGARATVLISAGDTVRAVAAYADAEQPARAAQLALALGDSSRARRLVGPALRSGDTSIVRAALGLVSGPLPPRTAQEYLAAAHALGRMRAPGEAAVLVGRAVEAGDGSAATMLLWGELEVEAGRLTAAVRTYERAMSIGGMDGVLAEYRRARVLVRVRRAAEGYRALAGFAERHSEHPRAATALYLVADWHRRGRRIAMADSLYRVVVERWPNEVSASRSRQQLASLSLARRDTSEAVLWYEAEITVGGAERHAARYLLAQARSVSGDTVAAQHMWETLARDDSLGYYGAMARSTGRLPQPIFAPPPVHEVAQTVRQALTRLDLLRGSYLSDEAEELVRFLMAREEEDANVLLGLAEGLSARGWVAEGVSLGWRATRTRTLNDVRVLRVIYPWPLRRLIEAEATKYELDPYLLAALIRQESTFRPRVISRAGAHGLMQLMPTTAAEIARRLGVEWDNSLLEIADANLHLGAAHLAGLVQRYDGNVVWALAAYNAGGRPVARWLRRPTARDLFLFIEGVPYIETRGYLRTVVRNRALYRALYPPVERPALDTR